jgi:hypothetical protein
LQIQPVEGSDAAAAAGSGVAVASQQSQVMIVEYKEPTEPRRATIPPQTAQGGIGATVTASASSLETPEQQQLATATVAPQQESDTYVHELLALYTPAALRLAGGRKDKIANAVKSSVALANTAYLKSNIPVTLVLLDIVEVGSCQVLA